MLLFLLLWMLRLPFWLLRLLVWLIRLLFIWIFHVALLLRYSPLIYINYINL